MQQKFDEEGNSIKLINSSVSGDTTGGGLGRLAKNLKKFDLNTNPSCINHFAV